MVRMPKPQDPFPQKSIFQEPSRRGPALGFTGTPGDAHRQSGCLMCATTQGWHGPCHQGHPTAQGDLLVAPWGPFSRDPPLRYSNGQLPSGPSGVGGLRGCWLRSPLMRPCQSPAAVQWVPQPFTPVLPRRWPAGIRQGPSVSPGRPASGPQMAQQHLKMCHFATQTKGQKQGPNACFPKGPWATWDAQTNVLRPHAAKHQPAQPLHTSPATNNTPSANAYVSAPPHY